LAQQCEFWHNRLKHDGNGDLEAQVKWSESKKNLKRYQRYLMYLENIKNGTILERCLTGDRKKFWQSVNNFKKRKKEMFDTSGSCKLGDFESFFKKLFSHDDRPNDSEQERVKSDVNNYFESIRDKVFDEVFTCSDLIYEINKLEYGKAPGYDFVVNEMVINAKDSPVFIQILVTFFNSITSYGYLPKNFNTSLLTPIPKKGISKTPSDFRPISVSSVLANIFELLLLSKIDCFREISKNHAYYLVNEVIHFYTSGKSALHVIILDASEAFNKMWRSGLFYRLKNNVESVKWESLFLCIMGCLKL